MTEKPEYCVHVLEGIAVGASKGRPAGRAPDVWIGEDFILAPIAPSGRDSLVCFDKISRVIITVSKGHIVGADVWNKGMPIRIADVKTPAAAVRAIFDRAPRRIKWFRTRRLFGRLSRDSVEQLLEQSDAPDIYTLLPPGQRYARAEDIFPTSSGPKPKGLLARWFGGGDGQWHSFSVKSLATPSPAGKYVGMMLLQMAAGGIKSRALRRSQSLPSMTLDSETVAPVPLDDVLNDLKAKCGVSLDRRAPTEGQMELTLDGTPYRLECRFDSEAAICCQIQLTKIGSAAS